MFEQSNWRVSWNQTIQLTTYKAENAGRIVGMVNPAYTSQDCSQCGNRQKMPLEIRLYQCPNCHLSIGRDINAAKNILSVGLDGIGNQSLEATSKRFGLVVE